MSTTLSTTTRGNLMQSDGFLITHQRQPRHLMSWPHAAKLFLDSRGDFLRFDGPVVLGTWSVTCFPFKGCTNKPLQSFGQNEMKRIVSEIERLKKFDHPLEYSRINGMESLLRSLCEYPPYPLDDDWDGNASKRKSWAIFVFRTQQHLRV